MNNDNINIEQLRKTWQEMGKALGLGHNIQQPENLSKMSTTLDKLHTRYKRMGIFALLAAVIMLPVLLYADFISEPDRMPIAFSYAVFLCVMGCIDFWLMGGIERINPLTMSVSEVANLSLHYKKCHMRVVMVAIPVVICWIACFVIATAQDNKPVIWGVIGGAVVGGTMGVLTLREFMSDYKRLSE